jgi:hypothetical protein
MQGNDEKSLTKINPSMSNPKWNMPNSKKWNTCGDHGP